MTESPQPMSGTEPTDSFAERYVAENREEIRAALARIKANGRTHVKTRHIADELDEQTSRLCHAMDAFEDAGFVEMWSETSAPTTWRIMVDPDDVEHIDIDTDE